MSVYPASETIDDPPPKAVLFCPACGRTVPLRAATDSTPDRADDGDRSAGPVGGIVCPACGTVLVDE